MAKMVPNRSIDTRSTAAAGLMKALRKECEEMRQLQEAAAKKRREAKAKSAAKAKARPYAFGLWPLICQE